MTNEMRTTYKQTSTAELVESLKIKMALAFERGYLGKEILMNSIDKIENELVARGYSWEQIEALEVVA